MGTKWSQAYPLSDLARWPIGSLRAKPGVYRIRAFNNGEPLGIARLNGIEPEGILHIGESHNLLQRLKSVHKAVILVKWPAHFAGVEFMKWRFNKLIPVEELRFDFAETKSDDDARTPETALHQGYRRRFLDRPPLDGTSGQRFKGIVPDET